MAQLNLEFIGLKSLAGHVTVNGEFIKLKKDHGKYFYTMNTEQPAVEVVIYQPHYYEGKFWFFWNLLYFLVSVFGLFDMRLNKRCLVLDARLKIATTQDAQVVIRRQNFVDGGALVSTETTAQVEIISNQQYYDKAAKKKASLMRKFKIAIAVVAVLIAAVTVVML